MTNLLKNLYSLNDSHQLTTANGDSAVGFDDIEIKILIINKNKCPLTVNNAWYVPPIHNNLFTVLYVEEKKNSSSYLFQSLNNVS